MGPPMQGLPQTQVEGVGLFIDMQFHSFPLMLRSKNTLTTLQGAINYLTGPYPSCFNPRAMSSSTASRGVIPSKRMW